MSGQRVIEGEKATLGKCWSPLEEVEQKDGPIYNYQHFNHPSAVKTVGFWEE